MVALCLSGLATARVDINALVPFGVHVTMTVVGSLKSSFAAIASPVSFVTVAVAPDWKLAPRTVSCTSFPIVAVVGDNEVIFGPGGEGTVEVIADPDDDGAGFSNLS